MALTRTARRLAAIAAAGVLATAGLAACEQDPACAAGGEARVVARPPSGGGRSGGHSRPKPKPHGGPPVVVYGDHGGDCDGD